MNNQNNQNDINGITSQMGQKAGNAGKKVAKGAGKMAQKATKKFMKKAAKLALKIFLKVMLLLIKLIIAFLPYILIALAVIVLLYGAWDIVYDSKGITQQYQEESSMEYNEVKIDEEAGDVVSTDVSQGNKIVKAFYTYFAEKSIWVTVTDSNGTIIQKEPLQYNSVEFNNKFGDENNRTIKDKYGREKMFYLNPNALYVLDEYLNRGQFRFPEQFIQPVYHDPDTFELKQLTNDNGHLVAESKEYDKTTSKPKTDGSKTKGVWDYGFGSILNYKKFIENTENRGRYTETQIWNVETQSVENVSVDTAKQLIAADPDKYEGFNSAYDNTEYKVVVDTKEVYLIDRVTSPAGFIKNQVTQTWVDTGRPFTHQAVYEMPVTIVIEYPYYFIEYNEETGLWQQVYVDSDGNDTFNQRDPVTNRWNTMKWELREREETQNRTFTSTAKGTVWNNEAKYVGNPDTSQITGNRYFKDYMANYEAYVPKDVMTKFDFENRTNSDTEELLKLLDREPFGSSSSATLDMDSFELGSGASTDNYKKALESFEYFQKYGEMYGVDPYLLMAKACQESGGKHDAYTSVDRCSSAGCGIMQIEQPGITITSATAFNHETGTIETMPIPNREAVLSVENNIKAGAMIMANRFKLMDYNFLLALQAYNYGSGAMGVVIDLYSAASGKTSEQIKQDIGDLGWMAYRKEVHQNPRNYFTWDYSNTCRICDEGGNGHYGDLKYIEHVLAYYVNPEGEDMWVKTESGEVKSISIDGTTLEIGSGTGTIGSKANDNWMKGIWTKFKESFNKLFPEKDVELPEERTYFSYKPYERDINVYVKMMFVMEEKKRLSEYEDFTDEDWKEKFDLLFSNPVGQKWGKGNAKNPTAINSRDYFPSGYVKPLEISPLTIKTKYSESHRGIDIVAPVNTNVKAIAGGRISKINTINGKKEVTIEHGNSVITVYRNLSSTSVTEGTNVTRGQVIGKTGQSNEGNVLHLELYKDNKAVNPEWIVNGTFNYTDYNMTDEDGAIIENIINTAHQKIGCPYTQDLSLRQGPNSFDCSGFTWWLYKTYTGVDIGYNTTQQESILANHAVPMSEIQPGDILFYENGGHVVLYIGNGMDIEAADYDLGVIKNNISPQITRAYRPISYVREVQGRR